MAQRTRTLIPMIALLLAALSLAPLLTLITPDSVQADPGVLYAAPTAQGNGDCTSWADACTLAVAVANATSGDEIWVKAGLHKPTPNPADRAASFDLAEGVAMYGGFAGTETTRAARNWQANLTVLSGDIDGNDSVDANGIVVNAEGINGNNAYHVVTIDTVAAVVVDGFIITAGKATDDAHYGGGMYVAGCGPRVTNVVFIGNLADYGGGGMVTTYGFPVLANVVFTGNKTDGRGGAMYNDNSSLTLFNVTFGGNSAGDGGGMLNYYSDLTLKNAVMWGDEIAPDCLTCEQEILNLGVNTVWIAYSDIETCGSSGDWSSPCGADGGGNVEVNPIFTNPSTGNLRPVAGSPVVDAGYDGYVPPDTLDLDGDGNTTEPLPYDLDHGLRIFGPGVDMGAYESQTPDTTPPMVVSIIRLDPNPTYGPNVRFKVTFSETVINVDVSDFSLAVSGTLSGAGVTGVSGSGRSYTVTAATGSGTGTLRLDVPAGATIADRTGNPLGGLPYTTGEVYTVQEIAHGTVHVAPVAQGSGSCGSWADACTLHTALAGAISGDEVWVKAGVYKPTANPADRAASFVLKNGVALYGGFAGTETSRGQRDWRANLTVLSGDIDGDDANGDGNFIAETAADIQGHNSFHVVRSSGLGATTVLDGFVITGGQADGDDEDRWGGGMVNDASNPSLANLIFSGNTATEGGGMSNYQSSPSLVGLVFSGNSAGSGGGMDNYASSPSLVNVTFSHNAATLGGGMDNSYYSSPTLTNVIFSDNTASYGGGGMFNWRGDPALTNVTFNGNSAYVGGGIYNDTSNPTLANCILWGDSATAMPEIFDDNSTPTVTYSDIQGGYAGAGNINADPRFIDATSGNLRLGFGSPATDAGTNTGCPATDLDGLARPTDGNGDNTATCDMGAYEAGTMLGSLAQGSAYSFPAQSGVSIQIVALGNLAYLYVDEMALDHPNATASLMTGRYWLIRGLQGDKATDASGFTVNLTLPTTFTPDAGDKVCRYTGTGQVWDCAATSHTNATITRDGVTAFSDWAASNATVPAAVTGISIAGLNSSQVRVTWDAAAGATGYEIWYAANASYFTPGSNCANPAPYQCETRTTTSFDHAALGSPASNYTYRVRAVNDSGASPPSEPPVGEFEFSLTPGGSIFGR